MIKVYKFLLIHHMILLKISSRHISIDEFKFETNMQLQKLKIWELHDDF